MMYDFQRGFSEPWFLAPVAFRIGIHPRRVFGVLPDKRSVPLHLVEQTSMGEQDNESIRAASGVVKWFDARKGFGFIIGPSGQDVLAHFSKIEGEGFRILKDGWTVVYDADKTPKGWKATRIVLPPDALKPNPPAPPPQAPSDNNSKKPNVVVVIKKPQDHDSQHPASGGDPSKGTPGNPP